MTVHEFLQQFFLDGGKGTLACIILSLLLFLFLSGPVRRKIRWVITYLGLHLLLLGVRWFCEHGETLFLTVQFFSRFMLMCALGLSIFLLLTQSRVSRVVFQPLPQIFIDILHSLVYAIALLITLADAGIQPTSLFAGSAVVTAVLGLSLRDTLGNLFAGLAIQAQRPFEVGDWIQFNQDQSQIGQVTQINWRATTVVTEDRVEITLPNGLLAQTPIVNYNRPLAPLRRIVFVHTPHDVPPVRVRQILLAALVNVPRVLTDPPPAVETKSFDERGTQYAIKFFIDDFGIKGRTESAVRNRLWYALARHGIDIPVPPRIVRTEKAGKSASTRKEEKRIAHQERALRCVDFFDHLPDEARRHLASLAHTRLYAEEEVIIRQGDHGDELYILEVGEVAVLATRQNDKDPPIEVARMKPGDFFGEMAALTGEPRKATVRAVRECEVLVVDKVALAQVFEKSPELAEHISQTIAQRQASLDAQMSERAASSAAVAEQSHRLLSRIKEFFSM